MLISPSHSASLARTQDEDALGRCVKDEDAAYLPEGQAVLRAGEILYMTCDSGHQEVRQIRFPNRRTQTRDDRHRRRKD